MADAGSGAHHLLDIDRLDDQGLGWLIKRTGALAEGAAPAALDRTVVNLFFEPSTRTRVSFELAAQRLGMRVVNVELERSSSTKGESLEDTAATLAAMGADALIVRHPETGRCHRLAAATPFGLKLVNAGDGSGHHPSQALLDVAMLAAAGVSLCGARIAIVGDIVRSRVARSDVTAFLRLGAAEVCLAGPADWLPESVPDGVRRADSLVEAVTGADVVVMLRIQHARMDRQAWPDAAGYHAEWGLRPEHLARAGPDCRVLHPGPINRGVEISDAVADGPQSLILDQVRMGVFARMAIFEWLFAADDVHRRG
ncbi:MAG: aspartate carbamoyltransferase catalytic subunit [Wenzhouxiangella sp.]